MFGIYCEVWVWVNWCSLKRTRKRERNCTVRTTVRLLYTRLLSSSGEKQLSTLYKFAVSKFTAWNWRIPIHTFKLNLVRKFHSNSSCTTKLECNTCNRTVYMWKVRNSNCKSAEDLFKLRDYLCMFVANASVSSVLRPRVLTFFAWSRISSLALHFVYNFSLLFAPNLIHAFELYSAFYILIL